MNIIFRFSSYWSIDEASHVNLFLPVLYHLNFFFYPRKLMPVIDKLEETPKLHFHYGKNPEMCWLDAFYS